MVLTKNAQNVGSRHQPQAWSNFISVVFDSQSRGCHFDTWHPKLTISQPNDIWSNFYLIFSAGCANELKQKDLK